MNKMIWITMGDLKKAYLLWYQEMKIIHEAKKVK